MCAELLCVSLGSFSSDDSGRGDDTMLKNEFIFTFECGLSVNVFSTPIGLKLPEA